MGVFSEEHLFSGPGHFTEGNNSSLKVFTWKNASGVALLGKLGGVGFS